MKVFVCIDDKNGMMFNKRRQSKDRVLVEKIKEIANGEQIFASEYSKNILPEAILCENFEEVSGFVFVENPEDLFESKIETLYVFKWNRHYPSDRKFNLNLNNFELVSTEDFAGYSHENITLEVYERKEG